MRTYVSQASSNTKLRKSNLWNVARRTQFMHLCVFACKSIVMLIRIVHDVSMPAMAKVGTHIHIYIYYFIPSNRTINGFNKSMRDDEKFLTFKVRIFRLFLRFSLSWFPSTRSLFTNTMQLAWHSNDTVEVGRDKTTEHVAVAARCLS